MVQHKIFDTLGFFILNRKLSTKPNIFPFGVLINTNRENN